MKEDGYKTFEDHMAEHQTLIVATLDDISDDRRPWVRGQVANTLLFRSGASYVHYRKNPARHASSLNEAICLRDAAANLYPNQEAYDKDAKGIFAALSPAAPVTVKGDKARTKPAFVATRDAELKKKAEDLDVLMQVILPRLEGFLNGAKYDRIDVQPSEHMNDRAHLAASKAFAAIENRVEQDLLFIADKWKTAAAARNVAECERWEGEGFFAEEDQKMVQSAINQGGYVLDS